MASFQPKEKGVYAINVVRSADEKHVKGSPFKVNVGDNELAHASKVHVTGQTSDASANSSNYFTVDTSGAGKSA